MNIAILITSFNRVKTTISALRSLYTSINKCNANNNFDIYLVDDKSPDNTGVIVKEIFPDINVIIGSGNLFWGGGTNLAWETATSQKEYDGFIWFNDDCELFEDSLSILLNLAPHSLTILIASSLLSTFIFGCSFLMVFS